MESSDMPAGIPQARILIAPDQMTAYLHWKPGEEKNLLDIDSLNSLLASHGLNPPDREEILRQLGFSRNQEITIKIAAGQPPVPGEDAKIIYHFETGIVTPKPTELADGRVDYYNLNTIRIVHEGQLLAEKTLPTQGQPGFTVTGKEVPQKPGLDRPLRPGSNTYISEDGLMIIAASSGQVLLQNEKVTVLPVYEVKGDIDFSIGNIDFPGSVTISGNVRGFQVKAAGSVEINGTVALGSKITAGEDVYVRGGILAEVSAGGKVTARFAEHATIKAGDCVYINDAVMYGEITAGKNIEIYGRGLLVGGTYLAGEEIAAKIIGSHLATPTKLGVGVAMNLQSQYHDTVLTLRKKEEELDAVQKNVKVLKDLLSRGVDLTPDRKAKLTTLLNQYKALQEEIPQLKNRENQLLIQIGQKTKGKINAREVLYPGVDIFIGNSFMRTLDEYHRATLLIEEGEIKVR